MENDHSLKVDRRGLLTGLGAAAAGMAFVNHAVADEKNPARQVADRSSSIRITGIKSYWVRRRGIRDAS